ncbi:LuxR C-terminal-related transcriptional regulator [Streptomyces sp. NRRL F-2664]|uniref:LuxR C-terminal-related transcriptional regulator n=1 Tax=Streptomyces sp. NRRL F-2664 TaxID=1463842 RepID=UPI000996BBDF|nr:LuxR C-terminal-related transcriptional regulator [Streptomyces sp. NRRL F-2664]
MIATLITRDVSVGAASAAGVGVSVSVVGLAPREREVLAHIAAGCTYVQTARLMGLSRHTVDAYVRRIRVKL